jgi:hypothetical protein
MSDRRQYTYTTQAQVRAAFWRDNPTASRRLITDYSGRGKMHTTDTRCAFVDFLDSLSRDGAISPALAQRATLRG